MEQLIRPRSHLRKPWSILQTTGTTVVEMLARTLPFI